MRIMITGAHGLLGQKIAIIFAQETVHELLLTDLANKTFFDNPRFDYHQLDITARSDVKSLVANYKPDVIINSAAFTDVDASETDREYAWRVNVDGLKNLIFPVRKLENCHIIQISTDYVFNGKTGAYSEKSRPSPISYYGKTKLAAENSLIASGVPGTIVRTQVLYGTGYDTRPNFVSWVLSMLEKKTPFKVVDDQIGNPTYADDLAYGIVKIAERKATGIYHVSGPEAIDRFSFARRIAQVFGFAEDMISRTKTAEIEQGANRPLNSSFITLKFESEFHFRLSDTIQGLRKLRQQYKYGASFLNLLADLKDH